MPIGLRRGENPIRLGVIMIMNREIGMVTPPLSRNLFMASDLSGKSVPQVAKIAIAIALVVLAALALATCLPFISLTLLGDG
jgi:TRAP-type C4-dicarboxylate transport system permease large subunit